MPIDRAAKTNALTKIPPNPQPAPTSGVQLFRVGWKSAPGNYGIRISQSYYGDFWLVPWARRFRLGFIAENARRPLKELIFPLFDLVGVHIELLG